VFEKGVLRKKFGPRTDEVTGEWRTPHNEEFCDMYCSPNIIWVIKSKRMGWVVHEARMGERKVAYGVLVRRPEGKTPLGRQAKMGG
jgi:hypothetical protein